VSTLDEALQALLVRALQFIPSLIVALITFVAALLAAGPAARMVRRALSRRIEEQGLLDLLAKLVRWSIVVIGLTVALEQVNFNVTGFLAGLGVAGLTIGFALQDIARNFVAGILLMIRQPFVIGDGVSVAGFAGTIVAVNTRDTVIRTWDGEVVIIPNTKVFENPISNYTRSETRMRTVKIALSHGQDAHAMMALLSETIRGVPGVLETPPPSVWADDLTLITTSLTVRFWVNTKGSDLLQVHSDAIVALNAAVQRSTQAA